MRWMARGVGVPYKEEGGGKGITRDTLIVVALSGWLATCKHCHCLQLLERFCVFTYGCLCLCLLMGASLFVCACGCVCLLLLVHLSISSLLYSSFLSTSLLSPLLASLLFSPYLTSLLFLLFHILLLPSLLPLHSSPHFSSLFPRLPFLPPLPLPFSFLPSLPFFYAEACIFFVYFFVILSLPAMRAWSKFYW